MLPQAVSAVLGCNLLAGGQGRAVRRLFKVLFEVSSFGLPEKVACLGFGVRFLVRVLQNPIVIPLSSCGSGAGVQAMSSQIEEAWGHM